MRSLDYRFRPGRFGPDQRGAYPVGKAGRHICRPDLASFRGAYVEALLERRRRAKRIWTAKLDRELCSQVEVVSQNPDDEIIGEAATFGERMATIGRLWGSCDVYYSSRDANGLD